MKLKFKVQPYQTHVVDASADCFAGQPKLSAAKLRIGPSAKPGAPVCPRQVPLAGAINRMAFNVVGLLDEVVSDTREKQAGRASLEEPAWEAMFMQFLSLIACRFAS